MSNSPNEMKPDGCMTAEQVAHQWIKENGYWDDPAGGDDYECFDSDDYDRPRVQDTLAQAFEAYGQAQRDNLLEQLATPGNTRFQLNGQWYIVLPAEVVEKQ